jgi:hypothetical protein
MGLTCQYHNFKIRRGFGLAYRDCTPVNRSSVHLLRYDGLAVDRQKQRGGSGPLHSFNSRSRRDSTRPKAQLRQIAANDGSLRAVQSSENPSATTALGWTMADDSSDRAALANQQGPSTRRNYGITFGGPLLDCTRYSTSTNCVGMCCT